MIQCEQQCYMELNVVIDYNVLMKNHHVSDDCNIETSNALLQKLKRIHTVITG